MKIYIALVLFLAVSCQKEIEINIPEQEAVNVVHCYLSPNNDLDSNFVNVEIQRTQGLNEQSIKYVTDATVVLTENSVSIDTLIYSNELNRYISLTNLFNPESGKMYDLEINTNNKILTSQTKIPQKIEIVETTLIPISYKNKNGEAISEVGIVFQDPPSEANYYEIVFVNYSVNYPFLFQTNYSYNVSSEDEAVTAESYYPTLIEFYLDQPKSLLFNDKTFNGELKNLSIKTMFSQSFGSFNGFLKQEVKITLRHVSEDYYLYKTKLYDHLYTQKENILSGIGEPQELHSNITNGLGVFGSYNSSVNIMFIDSMLIE